MGPACHKSSGPKSALRSTVTSVLSLPGLFIGITDRIFRFAPGVFNLALEFLSYSFYLQLFIADQPARLLFRDSGNFVNSTFTRLIFIASPVRTCLLLIRI